MKPSYVRLMSAEWAIWMSSSAADTADAASQLMDRMPVMDGSRRRGRSLSV